MRSSRLVTTSVVAALIFSLTSPARADRAGAVAILPSTLTLTSAVWDGSHAYIFGGMNGVYSPYGLAYSDRVIRFDPATRTTTFMGARLPTERADTAAVWTGKHAYVFGGEACYYYNAGPANPDYFEYSCTPRDEILRYDPVADTVTTMASRLPWPMNKGVSAVWDGKSVYLFGPSKILRFDPETDRLVTMQATLPMGRLGSSAIWSGSYAYVFGGQSTGSPYELTCCNPLVPMHSDCCNRVVRYDPVADVAVSTSAILPSRFAGAFNRMRTTSVWDGTHAYVFGGGDGFQCCGQTLDDQSYYRDIVRFDPATETLESMQTLLPDGTRAASSIWDGNHAYLFGGCSNRGCTNNILKYVLVPGRPQNFRIDPVEKKMTLRWDPPPTNSYSSNRPVTKYRIYKGSQPGILGLWAEVSSDTFSKTDTSCIFITQCYYAVAAVNGLGEGARSEEVRGLGTRSF